MSRDFNKLEDNQGGRYTYEPKNTTEKPMEGRSGERLVGYYGTTLTPAVVEEIKAWAGVLGAIKDGIPKPFDNSIIIDKIIKIEKRTGEDLTHLKQCCPPSAHVREAKELKPFIFGILDRIVDVSGIENYVKRYE